MVTMTLTVDNKNINMLEAFKVLASKIDGISFEINRDDTKEETLKNFRKTIKDIKSGDIVKNSISSEDFFKEFANG